MKQVIYYNERPIYLFSNKSKKLAAIKDDEKTLFVENGTGKAIKEAFVRFAAGNQAAMAIAHRDTDKLIKNFHRGFAAIEAAGGIVQNEQKEILFIFRNGKWDLPKGKLEKNEDPEEGAAREVEEETGISNLKRRKKIGKTYHIYDIDAAPHLKTTHWYYFTVKGAPALKGQAEEGITDIEWIPTLDLKRPMQNTYENIKLILAEFFDEP